jgi:hypothetical protein
MQWPDAAFHLEAVRQYAIVCLIVWKGEGEDGAPGAIRTPDLLVRSQLLYPAELRAHIL